MKLFKYIIVFIFFGILTSCSTIKVVRLNRESKVTKSGIIYTLPKTKLNINVEVVKTTYYKGPFSDFADEYLGIEKVIGKNKKEFKLEGINITPTIVNDSAYTYLLTNYSKNINSFSYFKGTQVLSALNTNFNDEILNFTNKQFETVNNFIPFKDRTIKPLVVEKSDTVWKTILVDSVYKRIPKVNTAISPRTIKEQAYLASRFILKIRKRRLRVLTGLDRKYPKGDALKQIIKELNKLENEYLNLFTGLKVTDTAIYNYSYIPDSNLVSKVLFNFDEKYGVSKNSKNTVSISFTDNDDNIYYEKINNVKSKKSELVYKTAKNVDVNILLNKEIYKSYFLPIYQVGILNSISSKVTKNKIIFDKKTGLYTVKN